MNKVLALLLVCFAFMVGIVGEASAALDSSIGTGLTSITSDFTALMALVYPFMITILSALIIFGLVKKLGKKSAS